MTRFLIHLFIKNKEEIHEPDIRKKYGTLAGTTGIICNLTLFMLKIAAGWLTNSISVMADAFNNLSDAGSSLMTLAGFRIAGKPADPNHPYGHGRLEYISGLLVSIVIVFMGFEIILSSVDKILHPKEIHIEWVSVLILLVSIGIKLWMGCFYMEFSKRLHSVSMKATAFDSFSDTIATTAVLLSFVIHRISGYHVDGLFGIGVSFFILLAGYNAAKETIAPLLGQTPDPIFMEQLHGMLSSWDGLIGYHDLIVHDYGPGRVMVTVHGEVAYPIDLMDAHAIIDNLETAIKKELGCNISIHMDPVILDDEETNELREYCTGILSKIDSHFSLHDFRISKRQHKSKLLFDVNVPLDHQIPKEELEYKLNEELTKKYPSYYAVIEMDYGYIR